jgi:spore coat polysaccharide biosynthesis protein SpsF (cytidylyltransferase family)
MSITREQYLQHRNNNQMSYELFWEYYQNNCDNPLITDFQTFIQAFSYFNNIFPVLKYDNIFEYYDNKFNITKIIYTKNSKIIGYV